MGDIGGGLVAYHAFAVVAGDPDLGVVGLGIGRRSQADAKG